jgi:hypothetical protein
VAVGLKTTASTAANVRGSTISFTAVSAHTTTARDATRPMNVHAQRPTTRTDSAGPASGLLMEISLLDGPGGVPGAAPPTE